MQQTHEVLLDTDLAAEWQDLTQKRAAMQLVARRGTDETMRADAEKNAATLGEDIAVIEEMIAEATRVLVVERMHPKTWGRLVAEHPPRPDVPADARVGLNTDTFDGPMMGAAITSVTDGTGTPVDDWDWDAMAEAMSPGAYAQIINSTLAMHLDRGAVPFSLAEWRTRRPSVQS